MEFGLRVVAGPDVEGFGFDDPFLQRWTPELEFIRT